jgi:putative redox protein
LSKREVTSTVAEVNWAKDYVFLGNDEAGHTIVFDSTAEKGVEKGISPMKALLACVGACSGMDVVAILGKRKQKLTSLKVGISGEREAFGNPRPFTAISLKYTVTGKRLERKYVEEAVTGSMEKYCNVAATVNGRAKIKYSYEILEG